FHVTGVQTCALPISQRVVLPACLLPEALPPPGDQQQVVTTFQTPPPAEEPRAQPPAHDSGTSTGSDVPEPLRACRRASAASTMRSEERRVGQEGTGR